MRGLHERHADDVRSLYALAVLEAAHRRFEDAEAHLREVGERWQREPAAAAQHPVVIGLAGYGNVSQGCQEILDCLPVGEIAVDELEDVAGRTASQAGPLVKVVFKEEHMVQPVQASGSIW